MKKTELASQLQNCLHISSTFADSAAERLIECENQVYLQAILEFIRTGKMQYLSKETYHTEKLMQDFGMDYLNAVLMLVWIEEEPEEALTALDSGIDDIV